MVSRANSVRQSSMLGSRFSGRILLSERCAYGVRRREHPDEHLLSPFDRLSARSTSEQKPQRCRQSQAQEMKNTSAKFAFVRVDRFIPWQGRSIPIIHHSWAASICTDSCSALRATERLNRATISRFCCGAGLIVREDITHAMITRKNWLPRGRPLDCGAPDRQLRVISLGDLG